MEPVLMTPQDEIPLVLEYRLVRMTPALARHWLKYNTANRPIRDHTVAKDARDMAAWRWPHNGEGIKWSSALTILDGQHRMLALVLAEKINPDVYIDTLVVFGLPPETQKTMDQPTRRTLADEWALAGEPHGHALLAIVRKTYSWYSGDNRFAVKASATNSEAEETLAAYPGLRRSTEVAVRIRPRYRFIPMSIVGLAHHLFMTADPTKAPEFFERIADGAKLHETHPILLVRNRCIDLNTAPGQATAPYMYLGTMIRGWNAYSQGKNLAKLQFGPKDEMPRIRHVNGYDRPAKVKPVDANGQTSDGDDE
mgnify:CR=1 FL=1